MGTCRHFTGCTIDRSCVLKLNVSLLDPESYSTSSRADCTSNVLASMGLAEDPQKKTSKSTCSEISDTNC